MGPNKYCLVTNTTQTHFELETCPIYFLIVFSTFYEWCCCCAVCHSTFFWRFYFWMHASELMSWQGYTMWLILIKTCTGPKRFTGSGQFELNPESSRPSHTTVQCRENLRLLCNFGHIQLKKKKKTSNKVAQCGLTLVLRGTKQKVCLQNNKKLSCMPFFVDRETESYQSSRWEWRKQGPPCIMYVRWKRKSWVALAEKRPHKNSISGKVQCLVPWFCFVQQNCNIMSSQTVTEKLCTIPAAVSCMSFVFMHLCTGNNLCTREWGERKTKVFQVLAEASAKMQLCLPETHSCLLGVWQSLRALLLLGVTRTTTRWLVQVSVLLFARPKIGARGDANIYELARS